MTSRADVRVLTAASEVTPIPDVRVCRNAFATQPIWRTSEFIETVLSDPPDWLLVQFNQFSYGRWGLNPFLPWALHRLKRTDPSIGIAWMAHEDFVPAISWKFAIMSVWQRAQFRALGRVADRIYFSIAPWVDRYNDWFEDTPVCHFPIGSNIPLVNERSTDLKQFLELSDDRFVIGFFGTLRGRLIDHIDAAVQAIRRRAQSRGEQDPVLLYVGPNGTELKQMLPAHCIVDAGRLPAEDVSRHLQIMDLHLTPFPDGISSRRGSFMAGLQHAVPTLGTRGHLTDQALIEADGTAFCLAPADDPASFGARASELYEDTRRRKTIGQAGRRLYNETYDFRITVPRFMDSLERAIPTNPNDATTPSPLIESSLP
ncbi:hypothetical protein CRI94_12495 [Longibacter salinarum]|uniref:Glycosyltransferase n=2 Tax=Longibacter salinarum TaxID=1850348 RepID=A0A2A8CWP9_9BACT|nr:hypothetical protein CRI94_12495 [Longibacter salinarum]